MTASSKSLFRAMKPKGGIGSSLMFDDLPNQSPPPSLRVPHDFYATLDPDAINALLVADGDRIRALGTVWEPACGAGDMVMPIRAASIPCCASDLIDRGCADSWQADYFTCLKSRAPSIITNPPYDQINARDGHGRWLRHTLDMPGWSYLALLLSWDWPAARQNGLGAMIDANPFSYCYLMRWKIDFTGEGSPPQRNAWFVWDRDNPRSFPGKGPHPEVGFRMLDRPLHDVRQGALI